MPHQMCWSRSDTAASARILPRCWMLIFRTTRCLYESRTQCAQRPTRAREAKLARLHLSVTNDRGPNIRGEHERMRRSPRRLQTKDAVPLKALEPTTHATPADAQRTGNLDLAEAAAACQYNLRAPSNLQARSRAPRHQDPSARSSLRGPTGSPLRCQYASGRGNPRSSWRNPSTLICWTIPRRRTCASSRRRDQWLNGSPTASGDCIANRATASRTVSSNRRFRVLPVDACINPRSPSFSKRSSQRRTVARSTSKIAAISLSGRPSLRARMIRAWRLRLGLPSLAIQWSSPRTSSESSTVPGRRAERPRNGHSWTRLPYRGRERAPPRGAAALWLLSSRRVLVQAPLHHRCSRVQHFPCTPVSASQQVTVIRSCHSSAYASSQKNSAYCCGLRPRRSHNLHNSPDARCAPQTRQ